MNEQNNTALIKSCYDAYGRGDVQAILNTLAPNVEWVTEGPSAIPYAGRYTGSAKVREFFNALGSTLENPNLAIDDYIAQGDKVATSGRFSATVKATGKRFDTAVAHVFTIQSGKITQFLDFFDTSTVADAYRGTGSAAGR